MNKEANIWWSTLGNNSLQRLMLQGELTTKYYSFDRIPKSLKDKEIERIYLKERARELYKKANDAEELLKRLDDDTKLEKAESIIVIKRNIKTNRKHAKLYEELLQN